jgi:ribosomal protein S18 acetylase RimI-like enzyme
VTITCADLSNPEHQRDVVKLTAAYASDEMGNGAPLPAEVLERLIAGLQAHPTTIIFLAYADDQAVGIATCFVGFSTFAAKELINIHDFAVLAAYRGQGVGKALMRAVENHARQRGCVKLTLEVQQNNLRARRIYESAGFAQAVYGESSGGSLFYTKPLCSSLRGHHVDV